MMAGNTKATLSGKSATLFRFLLSAIGFFLTSNLVAQQDTIALKNGNILIGEIKSMDKNILTFKTSYSKSDFKIKWREIQQLNTKNEFLIRLKKGTGLNGRIRTLESRNSLQIFQGQKILATCTLNDIVYLKEVHHGLWSRLNADISSGINVARANRLRQYNIQCALGYQANKWKTDITYSGIRSKQDSSSRTKRTDAGISTNYFLQRNWFLAGSISFLSNTEQALALRTTARLGAGNYVIQTSKSYLGVGGGASFNTESFTNEASAKKSMEAYAALELNLYDVKNIQINAKSYLYASLTEKGRWRYDAGLDAKFDLPLDFFIKPGFTYNYDNQPAIAGRESDYVFYISVGWEL